MGFLDKAMAAADQAATKAKEGLEDAQVKRDLAQSYNDLGRLTYSLYQRGEVSHPELEHLLQRVSELEGAAQGAAAPATAAPAAEAPATAPPAAPPTAAAAADANAPDGAATESAPTA